ncbi:IclR family transcriptional regulator [Capillimicrobium parvum]|uniref:Glycerol operon regulatory protein n=1 Tax=Capillimicrobium parvum TaxID=2884022 RepID=A0A9E6XTK1_9ACTN|nr:IclR family transcriptional regulator [Capillimicrobium parvum]UGS34204.1 HTH-type transcriptional regulator XynR [Capillimicrobium parvum]
MTLVAAGDASATSHRAVGSVARAIELLDALAAAPDGLGVNALARRIGVNPSTASRLLATLEQGGLVQRAPGGPYRLGLRIVALADGVLARLDIRELARPHLRALAATTGETATLSMPGEREAVTVDFVAAESSVVSTARVGRPSVPHATAAGKVMLAFGGGADAIAGGPLEAYTDRTIVDPAALAAEIVRVRERGWGEAAGEREPDLNALAAPVFGRTGELVAVLGVQGPATRLDDARRRAVLPALSEAAAALSAALGGRAV